MGDEYHGCFLHHRSVRVHTVVQLDGSLEVISKHVVDEMIPTYMCRLWILHPIWFELQDSRASSSQSAGDGHRTSRVQICMDIDGAHFDQAYEFHDTSSFMNQSTSLTENLDGIGGSPPNLEPLSDAQEFSGEDVANQFESEDLMLNLGGPIHKCTFCGAQMWFEERLVRTSTSSNLRFSLCCLEGKVWLPLYKETPVPLNSLLDYNGGVKAKYFRDNIRMYNSMFQFTSFGGKIDNEINRRPGPYVFRLCGQNHHKIGSLLPVDGETPKFAQLYIYDTANELANRMRPFSTSPGATKPDEDVVKQLMKMFDETNIIVRAFRMARNRFGDTDYVPVRLRLIGHRSER
ncbi:hypothetical protein PTKIN_Ptkin04bG0103400 [Pterospermum kingtungense]